ncbi:hypothetical protein [uncultured Gammaproteobacteria bacterium]|jgi:hypothetical protein|nr:hypothetical protein BROOK1789B_924 [Bathymodiolus brooksi thiotrophic gill symbiont]CAC9604291.1 hypothetical protein [uncultured Gammaproteobacteria bacterium]CAC9606196.1 hypothetical protein [uncultured Gammaproteobacteria bacterium]CAC9613418.1 hypothetical protein [uncultured Gammaproteobacteria bacterium]CAC9631921.1 hypothetical protein [uncultured Gammaproteobacteria bacterium]
MMKHTLNFVVAVTLATGVMAGGDDRDQGPVESLEVVIPSSELLVGNQAPSVTNDKAPSVGIQNPLVIGNQSLSINNQTLGTTKLTVGGRMVSVDSHLACQEKLGLSDSNVSVFKKAKVGNYLENTGPIDALGTVFSPNRWSAYFSCVDENGG